MTISGKLANFVKHLKYDNLSKEVINMAKECILDTLGGAFASLELSDIKGVTKEIKKIDKQNDCKIWGTGQRASLFKAVLINGTMSHAIEMDDVHKRSKSHAGTVIIPVALTLGEMNNISGKELILSIVSGYEVMLHIGMGIGAISHRLKGWHATSTCGTFGAAAVASKILGLNIGQIVSAFGIAGTQSCGLWAFTEDGSTSKKFHAGHAAECGVTAAILAKGGMTGPSKIIEAKDGGFFQATSDCFDFEIVTKNLGKIYEILSIDRKPFACCRSMHPSINAILDLKKEKNIHPENVKKIEVETYEIAIKQCGLINQPTNIFEAKFSIPYGLAVALFDGQVLNEQFSNGKLTDRKILDLAKKVKVKESKKYTEIYPNNWGCKLKVTTKENKKYEKVVLNAKGDRNNPLEKCEMIKKFIGLSKKSMDRDKQEKIIDKIFKVESSENINDLIKYL